MDQHIYQNEEELLKEEIMEKNAWTRNEIEQIIKLPGSRTIKITFTQATLAKKTSEKRVAAIFNEHTQLTDKTGNIPQHKNLHRMLPNGIA